MGEDTKVRLDRSVFRKILAAGFLSFCTVLCANGYTEGTVIYYSGSDIVANCLKLLFYFYVFYYGLKYYEKIKNEEIIVPLCTEEYEKKEYRIYFIGMVLTWGLYLLIFYPGVTNWDTMYQIDDFFNGVSTFEYVGTNVTALLNDHHPIFCTFFFSFFVWIGRLVGNPGIGLLLYSLIQIFACAFVFTWMLWSMRNLGIKSKIIKRAFLFFVLMPFIGLYVINMVKDSVYAVLFVVYYVNYIKLLREDKRKGGERFLLITSLLIPFVKKTGIYIVLLSNLGLLFSKKVSKKSIAISTILPAILMFYLLPQVLFPMFNIFPGGKQEVLGTCFQQTALLIQDHEEELSDSDKEVINRVLNYETIKNNYTQRITDDVKNTFKLTASKAEIKEYLALWIRQGMRHPLTYLKATLGTGGGYFSPTQTIGVYFGVTKGWDNWKRLYNPDWLWGCRDGAKKAYGWLCSLPGISLLFQIVLYVWWIPAFAWVNLMRLRNKEKYLYLIPIIVSILTLIVSPYSSGRYSVPLIYLAPFILGVGTLSDNQL